MKKIISIITLAVLMIACTERFERINKSPSFLSAESIKQDNNFGLIFRGLFEGNLIPSGASYQYAIDWQADNYIGHTGTPLDEFGGRDMMSYYVIDSWNNYLWDQFYSQMSSTLVRRSLAIEAEEPLYLAMTEMRLVMAASYITTYYGPIIYSEYGERKDSFEYDSEQELYPMFFDKLDEMRGVFYNTSESDAKIFAKFDFLYNGDTKQWAKMINSWKMRLAMRIVKADPTTARRQFEEAVAHPAGYMKETEDSFWNRFTGTHALWTMSNSWNDCRMGSTMEEVLVGFEDPRLYKMWREVDDQSSVALSGKFEREFPTYVFPKPDFKYKGIARGAYLDSDKIRDSFSAANASFNIQVNTYRKRPILLSSEIYFMLAEAAVRGWAVPNTAKEYYEEGIRQSFLEWEVTEKYATPANNLNLIPAFNQAKALEMAETYLNNSTNMPIDYVDPADRDNNVPGSSNSYKTRMTDPEAYTVKWRDDVSSEKKLERIMTQKWIAGFQNSIEVWSDFRRTGYPKIPYTSMNNSTSEWGIVVDGDFTRRLVFVKKERLSNPGLVEAIRKLGGENKITTTLWIHSPWVNHDNPNNNLP